MKKKFFEDPEMEVIRFDPRDAFIATSDNDEENWSEDQNCPSDCEGDCDGVELD